MKRRASYDDDYPVITAQTVHEPEPERDTFTGLYDQHGNPLHRPPQAVGFDMSRSVQSRTAKRRTR